MPRIKIFGAGSIGNHLANAARTLGWEVVVCDVSSEALRRMQTEIYPSRYGTWDDKIRLFSNSDAPVGGFDLIFIGTPPDVHMSLAMSAIDEHPKALLIEKPLCGPGLEDADMVWQRVREKRIPAFVGYDHAVGAASRLVEELLDKKTIGRVLTLDVEFREHWAGIFKAHPWLRGPTDSYLGFWRRGGGASGEHSHAINLWQHFAHVIGAGRVEQVSASLDYVESDGASYDRLALMTLRTERGVIGRVAQDVVTLPVSKRAIIQGEDGRIEWVNGYDSTGDAVLVHRPGRDSEIHHLPKKRPDDFIAELNHVHAHSTNGADSSPIALSRGLDTMLVVAGAHRSSQHATAIRINYSRGYTLDALESGPQIGMT
jgi:predicted dehydrogenase